MATLDASKLPAAALRALQAGRPVQLKREGKIIATLRASPSPFSKTELERARRDLQRIRRTDRKDDWADFLWWPDQ